MKVNITYPSKKSKNISRRRLLQILRWPFIGAALACIIVNICVGGKAWSAIAVVALFGIWKQIFAVDLVEYNRISQLIKSIMYIVIILALIDLLIVSIWAIGVLAIIGYSGLILSGILFLTDLKKQKQNMLPMFFYIIVALIASVVGFVYADQSNLWTVIVLAAVSFVLLFVCIVVLRKEFVNELKKGFKVK